MKLRFTQIIEFEVKPSYYKTNATPEEMLNVEKESMNDDFYGWFDAIMDMEKSSVEKLEIIEGE